jgi:hypothetical protein
MQATYVDVGADGKVVSDPSTIGADGAEFPCIGAYGMLVLAFVVFLAPRLAAHREEWVASLPEDLTGAALVHQIVEVFRRAAAASKAA